MLAGSDPAGELNVRSAETALPGVAVAEARVRVPDWASALQARAPSRQSWTTAFFIV
jgi:hypothetical protein